MCLMPCNHSLVILSFFCLSVCVLQDNELYLELLGKKKLFSLIVLRHEKSPKIKQQRCDCLAIDLKMGDFLTNIPQKYHLKVCS